jgi:hypothetical protein
MTMESLTTVWLLALSSTRIQVRILRKLKTLSPPVYLPVPPLSRGVVW